MFKKVKQFNEEILGILHRQQGVLGYDEARLSVMSLHEEAEELFEALSEGDLVGCVDAVCDSIYFSLGILHKLGISEEKFELIFAVIHEANMQKKIGINAKRDTGAKDAVKPEDWIPPEQQIIEILNESEVKH